MKKLLFSLAAAAAILTSCQAEKSEIKNSEGAINIRMTAIQEETKTSIDEQYAITWGTGEYVMMYYNDGKDNLVKSNASSADTFDGESTATFDFTIKPATAAEYTIGGIYPASAVNSETDDGVVTATIPAVQNASANTYDPTAYIMVIKPETVTTIPDQWQAWFRKAAALNKVTLKGVKSDILAVEFTAADKNLSGGATINMTTGKTTGYTENSSTVKVKYASALTAGDMDIWFTTWESAIASGETLTVTAYAADGYYTKTITAGANGIKFTEGALNLLSINFASVDLTPYTLKDFAEAFVGVLDAWEDNVAYGKTVANATINGHYIPADFTFDMGGVTYNKTNAYSVALKGLNNLVADSAFVSAVPTSHNKAWGTDPYNENSGVFKNIFVNLDFIRNFASRELGYIASNTKWSNMCGYSDSETRGTPSVAGKGYDGTCCLERHLLIMARFYKYLLDSGFTTDLMSIEDNIHINAGLYSEPELYAKTKSFTFDAVPSAAQTVTFTAISDWKFSTEDAWISADVTSGTTQFASQTLELSCTNNTGSSRNGSFKITTDNDTLTFTVVQNAYVQPTIKEFAQEYVKLLNIWDTTIVNMPGEKPYCKIARNNVHSIPMETILTVKGNDYTISQMLEVAMRSFLFLVGYDGDNTTGIGAGKIPTTTAKSMSATVPSAHSYTINYWYLDNSGNGGPLRYKGNANQVTLDLMVNYLSRNVNFAKSNGGAWGNFAGYNDSQLTNYTGLCTPGRMQIALLRTFKMLLDNSIDNTDDDKTVISTYLSDKVIDSTLYGNATYD